MIGDDRSVRFLAYVGQPWVLTNAFGQCLEVIMPVQTTRLLSIPASPRPVVRGAASPGPMSGSEQALRRYIDAVRRGEPNSDDMTPQAAGYASVSGAPPGDIGEDRRIAVNVARDDYALCRRPLYRPFCPRLG